MAPNPATYTGAILETMGYITHDQELKCEFLDKVASQLAAKSTDGFKKPFYGHIANGEIQPILDEYKAQNNGQELDMGKFADVKLGLKGEDGKDIERDGGPMKDVLKLQKELREMDKRGEKLSDDPHEAADKVREVAKKLGIKFPSDEAKLESPSKRRLAESIEGTNKRFAAKFDVDAMLLASTKGHSGEISQFHEGQAKTARVTEHRSIA